MNSEIIPSVSEKITKSVFFFNSSNSLIVIPCYSTVQGPVVPEMGSAVHLDIARSF